MACLLKAKIVKPAETAVDSEWLCKQLVASQERACRQAVSWALQKLVAEAGDSSETQKKGNVRRWKMLPSSAVKTVT
jgi:hypothetical protein